MWNRTLLGSFVLLMISSSGFVHCSKTACDLLRLPLECHCQRMRRLPFPMLINETRLRCRSLTEITSEHRWSIVPYDRLSFETLNDNMTVHRLAFVDVIARTLRLNIEHLFLHDHAFAHTYLGQLVVTHSNALGKVFFQADGEIFYGSTITNLFFNSIDFQSVIGESIFSNARIYALLIQSSKFYGFTTDPLEWSAKNSTGIAHRTFLDYETSNEANSSLESEETVTIKITFNHQPILISIVTIVSSINTSHLTEDYFLQYLEYSQTEEIRLSKNHIRSIDAHAFRRLRAFRGRLILDENQIEHLHPTALVDLISLRNLSLTNNLLEHLAAEHFRGMSELEELDLSFNRLRHLIHQTFQSLGNLRVLHLNDNPLERIDADTFAHLTRLTEIHFHHLNLIRFDGSDHMRWMWNLADLHATQPLNNNFDLTDVAFCILSHENQTELHISHQYPCSCPIHYLSRSTQGRSYLRLTPQCPGMTTDSTAQWPVDEHENLLLRKFEDQCDYTLIFLDCQAMTTKTELGNHTEFGNSSSASSTAMIGNINGSLSQSSLPNNLRDLIVLCTTLLIMTLVAIGITAFWYRLKSMLHRRRNKRLLIKQQQQYGRSSGHTNHYSTVPHSPSSTKFTKIETDLSISSQHPSPPTSFFSPISPTFDPLKDVQDFIDDDDTATENNRY